MKSNPPSMVLCAGAVVLRNERVLLIRQTYGRLKGAWSLPWGYVDNEPPDRAALRETEEEAGVTAEVMGLLGVQNHATDQGAPRLYFLYLCRHVAGEPRPDGHETDQAGYFSLAELDSLADPIDEFCEWVARRALRGDYTLIPPQPENPYKPHLAFF